ncbi:hypothetical protein JCM21900_001257 [Sporobolomyces salmonicolor]
MVLARELNIIDKIELDYSVKAMPTSSTTSHSHLVPHGKIPALAVGTNGNVCDTVIYGSENICAYLDVLAGNKALPPHGTLGRFEALTTEALASAMCDAALALRYERPEELLWQPWIDGQLSKIVRSIPILAKRPLPDPEAEVFGIAAALALWYMDKRAQDSNWRELEGGKQLNEWLLQVQERPSWKETPFVK